MYVVPVTGLVNVIALAVEPLQYAALETGAIVVVGFTVIVNVRGVPSRPLKVGVTVIVATTGTVPVFVAANDGKLPVPEAASPIVRSLFVQENVVPSTGLVNAIAVVVEPLQYAASATGATVLVGLTVIVND